jgi:hypothetical protein
MSVPKAFYKRLQNNPAPREAVRIAADVAHREAVARKRAAAPVVSLLDLPTNTLQPGEAVSEDSNHVVPGNPQRLNRCQ